MTRILACTCCAYANRIGCRLYASVKNIKFLRGKALDCFRCSLLNFLPNKTIWRFEFTGELISHVLLPRTLKLSQGLVLCNKDKPAQKWLLICVTLPEGCRKYGRNAVDTSFCLLLFLNCRSAFSASCIYETQFY